jgi:hypothetical protein
MSSLRTKGINNSKGDVMSEAYRWMCQENTRGMYWNPSRQQRHLDERYAEDVTERGYTPGQELCDFGWDTDPEDPHSDEGKLERLADLGQEAIRELDTGCDFNIDDFIY